MVIPPQQGMFFWFLGARADKFGRSTWTHNFNYVSRIFNFRSLVHHIYVKRSSVSWKMKKPFAVKLFGPSSRSSDGVVIICTHPWTKVSSLASSVMYPWLKLRENRGLGCSFFKTGKTQGICLRMLFLHRELVSKQRKWDSKIIRCGSQVNYRVDEAFYINKILLVWM